MPGFKDYWNVTGMTSPDMIYQGTRDRFQMYFDYMMGLPVSLAENPLWGEISAREDVKAMPSYPAAGFLKMVDDVLVIKLGHMD